jgi:protein-tyrosine phosphatase
MARVENLNARQLDWEGCYNIRDLGGLPTKSGKETRWKALVRADSLGRLTEAGQDELLDYGVRSIIDLRRPDELAGDPNPFSIAGDHGIQYTNVSLIDPAASQPEDFETLAQDYIRILDSFAPAMGEIMHAVAQAPEGTVLVHCMVGRDRTGMVVALLLELAGVPREVIAEDYALSGECLRPLDDEWLRNGPGDPEERARDQMRWTPRAEGMLEVLAHLDERYGSVEGYLRAAGVTEDDVDRIRRRLTASDT